MTVFGIASTPADLTRWPGLGATTLFFGATTAIDPAVVNAVPAGVMPVVCSKRDPTTSFGAATFKRAYDEILRPWICVPFHEPEANFKTPAVYIARFEAAADLRDASTNGRANAKMACKLLRYSGLHGYNWPDWLSGREDIIGTDDYNYKDATSYPDPVKFLDMERRLAATAGKPLAVFEMGSPVVPGDTGGYGYASWLLGVAMHARDYNAAYVMAWDRRNPTFGVDFTMTGPAYATWRALLGAGL